ncbi:hypothetical protein COLO4_04945 [Corchorus olitorius]|uniref:Uncharacterized protein n=1 Tax=Corchorus olitorius TaxID=93759 RepID=A0A1R3KSD2_9ROSI|nr:hypothetical protein COLO4_04945 [Corchorus olitorius]
MRESSSKGSLQIKWFSKFEQRFIADQMVCKLKVKVFSLAIRLLETGRSICWHPTGVVDCILLRRLRKGREQGDVESFISLAWSISG